MPDAGTARSAPWVAASTLFEILPPATRYSLRGGSDVRAAAARVFGAPLEASACRAGVLGARAALWLGPDEWLLLAPEADGPTLAPALSAALAQLPHSLVDVSHRQCAFRIAGPRAATLLAAGCPLDLDPGAFPPDMCTRTVLAKAEIILWRTGAEAFRVEVWRSYAAYLSQFLVEAGRGII